MNGNEPATKADLGQLRAETTHQYNDLVERIDDLKTELLSAFYAFAKSDQKRIAHVEGDHAALNSRIATIEERLLTVEQKLNLPPAL
jgi:chromosome segregation ATPase